MGTASESSYPLPNIQNSQDQDVISGADGGDYCDSIGNGGKDGAYVEIVSQKPSVIIL